MLSIRKVFVKIKKQITAFLTEDSVVDNIKTFDKTDVLKQYESAFKHIKRANRRRK